MKAKVKMPKKVKVGAHTYKIRLETALLVEGSDNADDPLELNGLCNPQTLTIFLRKGLPASLTKETLVHELFHALFPNVGGLGDVLHKFPDLMEEYFVDNLSSKWFSLLRENPQLVGWLFS